MHLSAAAVSTKQAERVMSHAMGEGRSAVGLFESQSDHTSQPVSCSVMCCDLSALMPHALVFVGFGYGCWRKSVKSGL